MIDIIRFFTYSLFLAALVLVGLQAASAQQGPCPGEFAPTATAELEEEVTNRSDRADLYDSVVGQLGSRVSHNQLDETATFTPPVVRLLVMAGVIPVSYHWCPFGDTSVPKEDEIYHSSMEWKMEKELRKPDPVKRAFTGRFDFLESKLKKMVVTNKKAQRDWVMDHH